MGRLLGQALVQRGDQVDLYERSRRDAPQGAHHVSAAMIAPLSELPDAPKQVAEMASRSMEIWRGLIEQLEIPHALNGSIVVAHAQDRQLLTHFASVLKRRQAPGVRELDSEELKVLEPELSRHFDRALLLPGEGWLDNRALHNALENRCGRIHYENEVDPGRLEADLVCDCRGAGADEPSLRGVLGEAIRVHAPEVALIRPIRLMHPRHQIYIAPRPDRIYVIGATELDNRSRTRASVQSVLELLSACFVVHSGFAEAEVLELGAGLRPAYPDNAPRMRWRGSVLSINGLYRHGYLVGPAVVETALKAIESRCN